MLSLFGYLDPGSGSMLLQILVGGIAGVGVAAKYYGGSWLRRFSLSNVAGNDQAGEAPANDGVACQRLTTTRLTPAN